ncbi:MULTISPECIES: hypothetical protein [unclassified Vibrio]|nr:MULTISPECIES: hypothetical protein [unclassified Vibrio]USD33957.1 hypothetical protein J8Z27_07690 [Vibrio sp. SCSIO 43186]USD71081.1 hypothetical protein J4N41_07695 [Vibrio sp. SCSIO 43139]
MSENPTNMFKKYWSSYGGFKAIFTSGYFYASVLLAAVLYPHWSKVGWWDSVLSIMPNLLGFTLGGFAMWVAIGDEHFKATIAGTSEDEDASPFMEVNATFAHFIFLQIVSILLALINKAYEITLPYDHILVTLWGGNLNTATLVFYYFSYFVFIYALVSALASVIALFTVSYWYDDYQSKDIGGKIKKMLAAEEEERKLRQKVADLQKKLEEGKT